MSDWAGVRRIMDTKDEDKIQEIIRKSGHDLHLAVVNSLRSQGWIVKVSPYYNDPLTNKPREIDIVAHKKYEASYRTGRNPESFILELFIECKYLPTPNVLWFEEKDVKSATALAKDNPILCDLEDSALRDTSTIPNKQHHYLQQESVMKLSGKTGNTDPFYEGMNGCLNAMICELEHQHLDGVGVIVFPVIVLDSFKNLYRRDSSKTNGHGDIKGNFQMEVNYPFPDKKGNSVSRYFLIDVVSLGNLPNFLESLESNDVQILKGNLAWQARRNSLDEERGSGAFDRYSVI